MKSKLESKLNHNLHLQFRQQILFFFPRCKKFCPDNYALKIVHDIPVNWNFSNDILTSIASYSCQNIFIKVYFYEDSSAWLERVALVRKLSDCIQPKISSAGFERMLEHPPQLWGNISEGKPFSHLLASLSSQATEASLNAKINRFLLLV